MKKLLIILIFFLTGCVKYQVVSEIRTNLYHLHSPKHGRTEIILTDQKLEVGEWYRINQIDVVTVNEKDRNLKKQKKLYKVEK
tara:strand:+ start:616 stop:864 length:249 start_codon:yes stop_codon:yes gene_type:complete